MDAEARLREIWAEAAPAAHDPAFAVAVMERVERRQLWFRFVTELVPFVVMLGVAGWALSPAIAHLVIAVLAPTADWATTGLAVALSVMLGVWLAVGTTRPSLA